VSMMAPALPRSIVRRAVVALLALPLLAAPALATTIERVVSPGGIEAWLMHEPAVPMIAIDFAFVGGAAQDAPGKGGTASLVASLLDEGAGDLDAKTFHARLERKAIELGFQAERDTLRGTLRTLTENKDEAFDYLRLAVTQPRFDQSDVKSSAPRSCRCCGGRPRARPTSPICAGGRLPLPIIPMAARSTAHSSRCRR